jgi:hypothetical protein
MTIKPWQQANLYSRIQKCDTLFSQSKWSSRHSCNLVTLLCMLARVQWHICLAMDDSTLFSCVHWLQTSPHQGRRTSNSNRLPHRTITIEVVLLKGNQVASMRLVWILMRWMRRLFSRVSIFTFAKQTSRLMGSPAASFAVAREMVGIWPYPVNVVVTGDEMVLHLFQGMCRS